MKRRIVAVLLAILTVTMLFAACGKKDEKSIIGTWVQVGKNNTYTFYEDGSGRHIQALQKNDITYELDGETLIIYDKTLWVFNSTKTYTYKLDGDTLKLTDGETTMTFSRQVEE